MSWALALAILASLNAARRRAWRAAAASRLRGGDVTATQRRRSPTGRRRSRTLRQGADASDAVVTMPDAVDLLRVAADAGLPPIVAVDAVAERAPPPWNLALAAVAAQVQRGRLFADAVTELGTACGDPGRRLAVVLRGAGDGADLALGLDRLAIDARDLRRRRTEEHARRVPVRLLAPLVLCALPAFVLLALAPLVAGAFEALQP